VLTANRIFRNLYRDSITLLQLATGLAKREGIEQAGAVMASPANLALMRDAGLFDTAPDAGPNDLLLVVQGADGDALDAALDAAEDALNRETTATEGPSKIAPRSIAMALGEMPEATLALIATPGDFAAAEARKALNLGLHVMLFSDNVAVEDEIALKRYARERDLMVMGPDCGTAIVNGVPLGFANAVRRGDIGLVAASGTGLQQVTCLIHGFGAGISQAIGTGGRDLKSEIGGITMLQGLDALANDARTKVIVLISKPPSADIAEKLIDAASRIAKPVVVNFLGAPAAGDIRTASTLEDAARMAVELSGDGAVSDVPAAAPQPLTLSAGQSYIRALYTGGTFCYEALALFDEAHCSAFSNVPMRPEQALADPWQSQAHTILDLGEDLFTRGRSHPMIDPRLRQDRVLKEAADPAVAVILFDVVLGYGAHPDPGGVMAESIREATAIAETDGRTLAFIGAICGTDLDPQGYASQEAALREAGATLLASNAQAVRAALTLVVGRQARRAS